MAGSSKPFQFQIIFTTAAFLAFEAKSMLDYGFAFFVLISIINCTLVYSFGNQKTLWSSLKIVRDSLKKVSTASELVWLKLQVLTINIFCVIFAGVNSTNAYEQSIGKIEFFNKFLCFTISFSLVIFFVAVLPYTFARYYIFNMGENSFFLFAPPWFVFTPKEIIKNLKTQSIFPLSSYLFGESQVDICEPSGWCINMAMEFISQMYHGL